MLDASDTYIFLKPSRPQVCDIAGLSCVSLFTARAQPCCGVDPQRLAIYHSPLWVTQAVDAAYVVQ